MNFYATSEARTILEKLTEQKWDITRTKTGHYRFVPPAKDMPIVIGSSTPGDGRYVKKLVSQLRRSGASL